MIYEWKSGSRMGALNPQVVGEELETLREKSGGFITAAGVLDAATPDDSPLHPAFEWDNAAAAEQYRKGQAGQLIASVVVRFDEKPDEPPVRAFVLIKGEGVQGFTSITSAMSNDAMRQQVVQRAWQELQQWQRRYQQYEELHGVMQSLSLVNGKVPAGAVTQGAA